MAVQISNLKDAQIGKEWIRRYFVETFGGWDSDAVKILKDLARQSARRWGKTNSEEIKFFFQRLSVSLQRGNAALLIERDADSASS